MSRKVEKIEAARILLESAVDLYFDEADPLPVWCLTAAAYNVVRDINSRIGGEPMMIKDRLVAAHPVHERKRVRADLNKVENFLKHADRDPIDVLDFPVESHLLDLLLIDAISKHYELTGDYSPKFRLYFGWFVIKLKLSLEGPESKVWLSGVRKRSEGMTARAFRDKFSSEASQWPWGQSPDATSDAELAEGRNQP